MTVMTELVKCETNLKMHIEDTRYILQTYMYLFNE